MLSSVQTVAESLRLYPQPPVLIRRPVEEVQLPPGATGIKEDIILKKGCDIFVSTWNLHRSPQLWLDPSTFDPSRRDARLGRLSAELADRQLVPQ